MNSLPYVCVEMSVSVRGSMREAEKHGEEIQNGGWGQGEPYKRTLQQVAPPSS